MQPEPSIARSCSPGRETAKIGDVGAQMTRERSKSAEWRKVVGALSALRGDYGDDVKRAVNGLLELHHEAQLAGADGVTQMIEAAFESGDPAQMERAWALWDGLEGAEKDRLLKR